MSDPTHSPGRNSQKHWALYLLARLESDGDTPSATSREMWELGRPYFHDRQSVSAAISALVRDHEDAVIWSRTGKGTEKAYQLTDEGKRLLRNLGVPDATSTAEKESLDHELSMPPAANVATGTTADDGRTGLNSASAASPDTDSETETEVEGIPRRPGDLSDPDNPPRKPNDDATAAADSTHEPESTDDPVKYYATLDVDETGESGTDDADDDSAEDEFRHEFVDPPQSTGHKRHIYEREGRVMVKRCGQGSGVARDPNELVLRRLDKFAAETAACQSCLRTLDDVPEPDSRALDLDVDALLSGQNEESDAATISLEPDWEWLAVALAELGHAHFAHKAMNEDLTKTEVYGPVLDILYQNRGEYSTPQTA